MNYTITRADSDALVVFPQGLRCRATRCRRLSRRGSRKAWRRRSRNAWSGRSVSRITKSLGTAEGAGKRIPMTGVEQGAFMAFCLHGRIQVFPLQQAASTRRFGWLQGSVREIRPGQGKPYRLSDRGRFARVVGLDPEGREPWAVGIIRTKKNLEPHWGRGKFEVQIRTARAGVQRSANT